MEGDEAKYKKWAKDEIERLKDSCKSTIVIFSWKSLLFYIPLEIQLF